MLAAAILQRTATSPGAGAVAPSSAAAALLSRGKSPGTWNRYASTLTRGEAYATLHATPFLPADPTHFANFLAEAAGAAGGGCQTKQRVCAIDALSAVARVPSPASDALVRDVRDGLRRAGRSVRGRRARPVFSYELPTAASLPSPSLRSRRPPFAPVALPSFAPVALPTGFAPVARSGPRHLEPGGADAPLSVHKRARAQALRTAAILEAAGLRYDDLMEAQLGDAIFFGDLVDLAIFGSKTDPLLVGQAAVMPASAAPNSGAAALREGTLLALHRLRALPDPVSTALASVPDAAGTGQRRRGVCGLASGSAPGGGTPVPGRPAGPLPACLRPMPVAAC